MDDHLTTPTSAAINGSSGCFLDTSRAERAVFLMKCPAVVSRSLQCSEDTSPGPVAKLVVSIDPLQPDESSSHQFTMELMGTELGNVPKCYSMVKSEDFVPMSVFSESAEGKLSVEGNIRHKLDMRPHSAAIESYGKLCRERTNKYMTKSRQIQVIDDNKTRMNMRPMPGMVLSLEKKRMPMKGSEMKRSRRDRGEMEEIMFRLFEKQPHWTLRQLIQDTDQPEQFLKDLLKDLCVYNNKGANQGTYELKPEYKKSVEELKPEAV